MIETCGWSSAWRREAAHLPEDDLKFLVLDQEPALARWFGKVRLHVHGS